MNLHEMSAELQNYIPFMWFSLIKIISSVIVICVNTLKVHLVLALNVNIRQCRYNWDINNVTERLERDRQTGQKNYLLTF